MLKQEPTKVEIDPRSYLTLIYGEAGVGKTSFGAQIPGHYFLATEPGISGVSVFGDVVPTWEEFLTKCSELKQAKQSNFEGQREIKVIVIDTYDALWDSAAAYIMKKESFMVKGQPVKFNHVDDVLYGKAYKRVNTLLINTLQRLRALGFGVLLLAHSKEKTITWRGQEFTTYGLRLSASSQDEIVAACDVVGFAHTEESVQKDDKGNVIQREEGRYIYWQPAFLRTAKHRFKNFPERTYIPLDKGWREYTRVFTEVAHNVNSQPVESE